ncbi:Endonuclease/exonuclease/phosphatase [Mycena rosella]|uniref:Endonuclease/exonuclease/phosphatase n=1 Tax=Mycena rosella TaxID=1033263 RepID=A0AAD7DXR1_MYCRO|nr:Endonuclease/exonuclease/phosphatase [Mycena rosella]
MAALDTSIKALLRPSDEVKAVLEALVLPSQHESGTPDRSPESRSQLEDARNKRILAVVSHSEAPDAQEEGSVFILKSKPIERAFDQSDILRVFPVFGDFSISMSQVRRETLDLRSSSQASPSLLSLTITQGGIDSVAPLTLCTQHVEALRNVLAECKRLKEVADVPPSTAAPPLVTFSWLAPYTARRAPMPALSAPQDLRVARKPLHTRLSRAFAGDAGDDASDVVRIRDAWLRARVRETCSTGTHELRVRIGTFNVNGNLPSQDLSSWLGTSAPSAKTAFIPPLAEVSPFSVAEPAGDPFEDPAGEKELAAAKKEVAPAEKTADADPDTSPDLLVLGFQELDLSTEALIYAASAAREDAWCGAVFAALGERAGLYEKLASKQLVGMLSVVLVKKALRGCFGDVRTCAAGTGIMGLMGNKGGTAVRLVFTPPVAVSTDSKENTDTDTTEDVEEKETRGSTVLTFVNAHLAAFDEMVERRNADFHELARKLRFDLGAAVQEAGAAAVPVTCNVFESDVLFWMVNLNYRIDVPDADVRVMLGEEGWEGRFEVLLKYDQLKSSMRAGKAFDMFDEGRITHLPTYRFNPGLLRDDMGYDLKRRPAWTDRVLYSASAAARVEQLSYAGHPLITMSDHRPVSAEFVVSVDVFDRAAAEAAAEKFYAQLNGLEDAHEDTNARVNLKIVDPLVGLGKVSYGKGVSRRVGIRNVGKVPCAYRLVPVDGESAVHPDWLKVEPMTALLLPDELAYITLTTYIDNASAARLNIDHKALECTLILHTVMGKDHFIAVTAEYVPTCFANSLGRLTRLPGPIRALAAPADLLAENRAINAPREIMRLVNWLMGPNINLDNLFVSAADETMVDAIRECLDTGAEFTFSPDPKNESAPVAFGETLLRLLNSLTEPIVPVELQPRCVDMTSRDEAFEMLDAFPPAAVNVWISVTAFLHYVCQSSAEPETKTKEIASVFAPVLLRDAEHAVSPVGRRHFLMYFIS